MLSILNSHMYVLKYDDFSLPEKHQKPFFRICLTSAQLRSRLGDEKRVAENVRSLYAIHNFGGRTRLIDIFWQPVI